MQSKHNCTGCGLVGCTTCLKNYAMIQELGDFRKHRLCSRCFDGSVCNSSNFIN
jgi:hypothetical protein